MNGLISASSALPAPSLVAVLQFEVFDVPATVASLLLLAIYFGAVRRLYARGLRWPVRRSVAWGAGVAGVVGLSCGGVGRYAPVLLWVYTLQVVGLLIVCPVLLAYGRPVALAIDASMSSGSGQAGTVLAARATRLVTSPLMGPLAVPVVLAGLFFTPLLQATLTSGVVGELVHLSLLIIGLLLAIGLVGDGSERESPLALGAAVAIGFVEFLLDAVPGIVLRLRTHLVAAGYWAGVTHPGRLSPLADQQRAGAILWFVAEFADIPFLIILIRRWIRADERDARVIDQHLDAQEQRHSAASGSAQLAATEEPQQPDQPSLHRPWWETDPQRLGQHRRRQEYRDPGAQ